MCNTLQRYKFESNSQLSNESATSQTWCAIHCKDTNLKAIHNPPGYEMARGYDVQYTAKIQIWKQFTTACGDIGINTQMCNTLQRYKFESNSQLMWLCPYSRNWCAIHCKDTNLKAIHNSIEQTAKTSSDVQYTAKIQIWKQFTTVLPPQPELRAMCNTLQRYKFESNSQLSSRAKLRHNRCAIHCKDTNLKAIHNWIATHRGGWVDVQYTAKIQIWKQFTTQYACRRQERWMCNTLQRYKFESNSQLIAQAAADGSRCAIHCKDTNLKAIHNTSILMAVQSRDVQYTAKIQIWKQFTTIPVRLSRRSQMCNTLQRYKFESNSQRTHHGDKWLARCAIHCKDTNLKAIHNCRIDDIKLLVDVQYTAKIQIWKQFTTDDGSTPYEDEMCNTLQRYKFESNSQPNRRSARSGLDCKDTNLKAIHNCRRILQRWAADVQYTAKIQIWKQFTTAWRDRYALHQMCNTLQRYKFESNSQLRQ